MKTRYLRLIKKQRGFTLIELLAVILILGIIALIAIPTVSSVVEQSRHGAAEQSAKAYVKAVNQQIIQNDLMDPDNRIEDNDYTIAQLNSIGISIKGTLPEDKSTITISNGEVTKCELFVSGYVFFCNGDTDKLESIKLEKEPPKISVSVSGKLASITITDNEGVTGYYISETSNEPSEWNEIESTKKYETTFAALAPGTFYVHAKDYSGNKSNKSFVIGSDGFSYEATSATSTYNATLSCSGGRTLKNNSCYKTYTSDATKCGVTTEKYDCKMVNQTCNTTCNSYGCKTSGYIYNSSGPFAGKCTKDINSQCEPGYERNNTGSMCIPSSCAAANGKDGCSAQEKKPTCVNGTLGPSGRCYLEETRICTDSTETCTGGTEQCQTKDVAKSCTKEETQYKTYNCNEGDTLTETTCTHVEYSCPDGGTLSGTICVR